MEHRREREGGGRRGGGRQTGRDGERQWGWGGGGGLEERKRQTDSQTNRIEVRTPVQTRPD